MSACGGLVEEDPDDEVPPHNWHLEGGSAGADSVDHPNSEPRNWEFSLGSHQWVNEDPSSGELKTIDGELCLGKDGTTLSVSWPDQLHEPLAPTIYKGQAYRAEIDVRGGGGTERVHFTAVYWDHGFTDIGPAERVGDRLAVWQDGNGNGTKPLGMFTFRVRLERTDDSYVCVDNFKLSEVDDIDAYGPPKNNEWGPLD